MSEKNVISLKPLKPLKRLKRLKRFKRFNGFNTYNELRRTWFLILNVDLCRFLAHFSAFRGWSRTLQEI
jgi:hypothetical protein